VGNKRNLSELDPHIDKGQLRFDCPACPEKHHILIRVTEDQSVYDTDPHCWKISGKLPNITTHPSINSAHKGDCGFHGWVKNGEVTW